MFTTKEVTAGGFYRGKRTGPHGAHTKHGNYVIDYRRVRHYVMPDLKDFTLTPYVNTSIHPNNGPRLDPQGQKYERFDGKQYLKWWREGNPREYQWMKEVEASKRAQLEQSNAAQEVGQAAEAVSPETIQEPAESRKTTNV